MDRQTLSHYGWIVVVVLVICALLGTATPFGNLVKASVEASVFEMANGSEDRLVEAFPNSVDKLQKQYKFDYYSSLHLAVEDLNNSTRDNADVNKKNAVAGIYTDDNGVNSVVLLKDTEESESVRFSQPCILNLGGNTLKLTTAEAFLGFGIRTSYNFTAGIDGSMYGSSIEKELTDANDSYLMSIACDNFKINGGKYLLTGTYNCQCIAIRANSTALNVELNDCNVILDNQTTSGNNISYAVSSAASKITVNNSVIKCSSANAGDTAGITVTNSLDINNSTIYTKVNPSSASTYLATTVFNTGSGKANIKASKLTVTTPTNTTVYGIYNRDNAGLTVENTNISAKSLGDSYGIYVPETNSTEIKSTTINSDSINGQGIGIWNFGTFKSDDSKINSSSEKSKSFGIKNSGTGTINNTVIFADASDNTVGVHNLGYESLSVGASNYGTLTFNSTSVYGTLAGVNTHDGSKTYVDGGTFSSCSHGGFYFAHGSTGEAYVKNATIKCRKPVFVDSKFDTSKYSNTALGGFYVGGGNASYHSNISVYIDNCDISGGNTAFVIRGSDGEKNNKVYISNSSIGSNKIRIDNDTHKLYIGKGNNFTKDKATNPACVVETNDVYTK